MDKAISYRSEGEVKDAQGPQSVKGDYQKLLDLHGLAYQKINYHLYVSEIGWIQGWMLDISIVTYQLGEALKVIIPVLIKWEVPFRMVKNIGRARSVLNGELGLLELGKVITVFPHPDKLVAIAQELIEITQNFRGPVVLTDAHLGSAVYTRYGAGIGVELSLEDEARCRFIYDNNGNVIQEPYDIPFAIPPGIEWPYDEIGAFTTRKPQTTLQDKYRPMGILKNDAKGQVRKGLWLRKLYDIRWVVIKEGKFNMVCDSFGRDIADRLQWQFNLHKDLEGKFHLPKVYDFFQENGNTYLVMELIKGIAFEDITLDLFDNRIWHQLDVASRSKLLKCCLTILDTIQAMHDYGYIHRDVTPTNFLIDKDDNAWMIDLELAYSTKSQSPSPPFRLGTPGYISPEQFKTQTPTVEQDVYAIGALILSALSGLLPVGFATMDPVLLNQQCSFFIHDKELANKIASCFSMDPNLRPTIAELRQLLQKYTLDQPSSFANQGYEFCTAQQIKETIHSSLLSLTTPAMMNSQGLWFARAAQLDGFAYEQDESFSVNGGLYNGISGVIYTLAQATKAGFPVDNVQPWIEKCINYIRQNCNPEKNSTPTGLYNGTSGIALTLLHARECGIIDTNSITWPEIKRFALSASSADLSLAVGLSGQAMALLETFRCTGDPEIQAQLEAQVDRIISLQQRDGYWYCSGNKKSDLKLTGLLHGTAGVTCLLLAYLQLQGETFRLSEAINKALRWLVAQAKKEGENLIWPVAHKTKNYHASLEYGATGIVYCLLKAYDVLGNPRYRDMAVRTLRMNDPFLAGRDLTQAQGLIGLGEIYLEASRLLDDEEWYQRAGWIATYVTNYRYLQEDGSSFWMTDGTALATPGFMVGNCGITHFLMRYLHPRLLDHPLLF